jgi:hypothetical protein
MSSAESTAAQGPRNASSAEWIGDDQVRVDTAANASPSHSAVESIVRRAESLSPDERRQIIARLSEPLATAANDSPKRQQRGLRRSAVRWEREWAAITARSRTPSGRIYSAPRRFDLATIFVVTAAYAILLGTLSACGFLPVVSLCVAGFITGVGIGQAALFRGQKPRLASTIAGGICFSFILGGFFIAEQLQVPVILFVPVVLIYGVILGVPLGYVAGVLVGGVFLVADVLRRRFVRKQEIPNDALAAPVVPADDSPSM